MKNEIKLWEQYNKWVEEQNNPLVEAYKKRSEEVWAQYDKDKAQFEKDYEKWKKKRDSAIKRRDKKLADLRKQPWYKKIFKEEPRYLLWHIYDCEPIMPSFPWVLPYHPLVKESYEGFLDWLVKK